MTDVLLAPAAAPQRRVKPVGPLAVSACAAGVLGAVGLGMVLGYTDIDVWGAFVLPLILVTITVPMLRRSAWLRAEGLVGLASLALVAKFVGSYLRYVVEYYVYPSGDSALYHLSGVRIAEEFLDGRRSLTSLVPTATGTQFIEALNGIVSLLSGRSIIASFMVFSWLAYIGSLAFIAAARRACPNVRLGSYAVAVFFLPSMLFWPSALGKDAWMVFAMGLFACGFARVLTGSIFGLVGLIIGGFATALVRPHVTVLLLLATMTSLLGQRLGRRRIAALLVVPAAAVLVGVVSASAAEILPNVDQGVNGVLTSTLERTSTGGSEFEAITPNSIVDFPAALVTVLFRPFVFESSSLVQLVSALEGTCILIWVASHWRRLALTPRALVDDAYFRLSFVFVLGFGFAWSSIGNLGILVRQRVQVLPFLFIVLMYANRPPGVVHDFRNRRKLRSTRGNFE